VIDVTEPAEVVTVTCHTEGCGNAEVAIDISRLDDTIPVVCGPCGQPITDVSTAAD
jgi:hypothetical protein